MVPESSSDDSTPWPTPFGMSPPPAWFQPQSEYRLGESVVITPEGQFYGWSHDWHTYHTSMPVDWKATPSATGNKAFHQGSVTASDGSVIEVGVIPFTGAHAANNMTPAEAAQLYGNPEHVKIVGRANETGDGCQINGFVMPGTTFSEVAKMRTVGLSGDWRYFPQLGDLDFVGPKFVGRQGLPKGVVTAAASVLDVGSLFTDDRQNTYEMVFEGATLMQVTASYVNTATVTDSLNTMTYIDTSSRPTPPPTPQNTVTASEAEDSSLVQELVTRLETAEQAISAHSELLATLTKANETIEQLDQETPDS